MLVGDLMVVKAYRKLVRGEHPELEIGRFLTEVADYRNTPALLGAVQHVEDGGPTTALMIVQAFVRNQGDGWTFTLDQLVRYLDEIRLGGSSAENPTETSSEDMAFYLSLAGTLGQRTAELHRALAVESGNPAFEPEPITEEDTTRWVDAAKAQAERAFASLEQASSSLTGDEHDGSRGAAGPPPGMSRPDRLAHRRGCNGVQDALSWRLSSGAGAQGAERLVHHRLRR